VSGTFSMKNVDKSDGYLLLSRMTSKKCDQQLPKEISVYMVQF